MKTALWILTALLAAAWTGLAASGVALTDWLAGQAATTTPDWRALIASWPIPAWAGLWVDTAALEALRNATITLLTWLESVSPDLSVALGWLEPLIWVAWGVGLACMLAAAGLAHWAIGRLSSGSARASGAGPRPL